MTMNTTATDKGPLCIDRIAQWRQRDQERQEFPCPHCSFCGVPFVTSHAVISHDCPRFRSGDYQVAHAKRQEHAFGIELLCLGGAIVIVGFLAVYGLVLYGTIHPLLGHVVAFLQQVEESL
jgi:hypothetical protein